MKKYAKIIFTFFIVFGFNSVVYASNQCLRMPGQANNVIIPSGYSAQCYYEYNSGASTTGTHHAAGIDHYILNFANISGRTRLSLDFVNTVGSGDRQNFMYMEDDYAYINYNGNMDFDGLNITSGADGTSGTTLFGASVYDGNTYGCPEYMYWVLNNQNEKMIGFGDTLPSLATSSTRAVYSLSNSDHYYDDVVFIANDPMGFDIYEYESYDADRYNELIEECNSNGTVDSDFDGFGDSNNFTPRPDDSRTECLIRCTYYFELQRNSLNSVYVDFTYNKVIQNGQAKLEVSANWPERDNEFFLREVRTKTNSVDLNSENTYSNVSDFLVYNMGSWSCAQKIYIVDSDDLQIRPSVFGVSNYGNISSQHRVAESGEVRQTMCSANSGSVSNPSTNNGEQVEATCEGILGEELLNYIREIFTWVKIAAPILVIVLGSVDFAKAVLSDDQQELKKASGRFIKRCIIAVAIFFVPNLIMFLISFIDSIADVSCDLRLW